MSSWWATEDKDVIDWAEQVSVVEHYFPSADVAHLTLDQLWDKLRHVKRLLGIDDTADEKKGDGEEGTVGLSPDEWFKRAMAGEIEVEDIGGAKPSATTDPKEMERRRIAAELRRIGIVK